ncbi:hypothetical protein B0O80DRAFT_449357 [Mortierella sp. GBAus27b]|nr:hypothetical protein B0O80DRAFT_449357 [Mortierella sp. GBAus27b]
MDIDVPVTDSGFGSRTLDFEPEDTDMEAVSKANKHSESAGDGMIEESEEKTISADKESEESGATERPKDEEAEVEEEEDDEDEDDMNASDLANEEEDFSKLFNLPGAILNPKEQPSPVKTPPPVRAELSAEEKAALEQQDAKKMVEESRQLQSEIKALQDQHRKHQRDADDLTESMVADTKILLRLFGIPYLVAPMEAEAQCADLQQRGVVDGILTEDSDVFLFGGGRVFKNMFKEEKYVECYLMSDIERDLGVGRDRLVALAYLLGSDYTTGIKGVGLITAMEIIKLFPKLDNFARWWRGEQEKASGEKNTEGTADTDSKSGLTDLELDSIDEVALEKLAKQCKKVHVPSTFPDPHVADAYIHPMVDDDPAEFQWGIPDLDGLRDFLRKALSWDRGEVDQVLLPIIRQMSSQQVSTQTTLDTFFDSTAGMGTFQSPVRKNLHKSARLRKAVDGLTGRSNDDPATDKKEGKSGTTKRAGGKRKATTKKDKRAGSAVHDDDDDDKDDKDESLVDGQADEKVEETTKAGGQDDNESDDEEGFVDELEKKKKQRTSKKTERTPQTKVPESVMAAKRQLKSKDLEVRLAERIKNRAAAAAAAIASSGVEGSSDTRDQPTQRKRTASGSSGDDSGDDGSDRDDDFAPSHWDLLAERQRHLQGQQVQQASPKKGTGLSSGRAPSLSAMVSASNAARYGSSFRNKETDGRAPKRSRRSQGGL